MTPPPDGYVRCPPGYWCSGAVGNLGCENPCDTSISRRAFKKKIHYLTDEDRQQLANQAMSTPLASYAYKNDPPSARRRLGFIIDDQPNPSFAVDDDRTHVDLYGYTSMLLATVQEQQKEIAELKKRLDRLEEKKTP
jgi:hypothetical protein